MLKNAIIPLFLGLAACAPAVPPEAPARRAAFPSALPPMKSFPSTVTRTPTRSNAVLARDFLDLSFQMESGRALPILTRFEGRITVRAVGKAPPSLGPDLGRLLDRLRREARIDILGVPSADANANITIEAIPRRELQRVVPQAACFVVPRVSSWAEYKRERRGRAVDWTTLTKRTKAAIFVPGDVSPQEIRDCLHEELAQALGPLNDLYRLPDSVFNDDNFNAVLTGFDMLMLRAYYSPELRNGMTRDQVQAALPGILARINPKGASGSNVYLGVTPRYWIDAIETALGPRTSMRQRVVAARRAVAFAEDQGWNDSRYAFSLFALGRLSLGTDPETSLTSFLHAGRIYASQPDTKLQAAHVAMQMAAFAVTAGQAEEAIAVIDANIPTVVAGENASLLATFLMLKAEALDMLNRGAEARAARLDSLGWARYGFGSDRQVRTRLSEISALSPRRQGS